MLEVNRRWCIYCFGESHRRLPVKFFNFDLGLMVEYEAPVCQRCFTERTRPLCWDDVPERAERIRPAMVEEGRCPA